MTKNYKDWLDLDVDQIEPMNLSDSKKAKIKHNILKQNKKKRTFKHVRLLTAAALISISVVTTMNFAFPTLASQIPFINNVMNYFSEKDSYLNNYTDLATNIGQVQTSNGVSFMIENAVFDGTTVTVSYAIETDLDLGDSPHLSGFVDVKGASGMGGTGEIKKINENTYVGIEKITPHFNESTPDELKINWEPKSITNLNTNTEIAGDWQFSFKLPKLKNKMELVNGSTTKDGVTFVVKSIEKNDMSTVIHYDYFIDEHKLKKWSNTTVQFNSLKDDLGNVYKVDGNGAVSNDNGASFKSSGTIKAIDANAKSLTIVPTIYFSKGSGKGLELKEMDPVIIDLP